MIQKIKQQMTYPTEFLTRERQEEIRQQQIEQWTQMVKCKVCGLIQPRTAIGGTGIDRSGKTFSGCNHIKNNNDLEIATAEEIRQLMETKEQKQARYNMLAHKITELNLEIDKLAREIEEMKE